jgi:hypothetical protein
MNRLKLIILIFLAVFGLSGGMNDVDQIDQSVNSVNDMLIEDDQMYQTLSSMDAILTDKRNATDIYNQP